MRDPLLRALDIAFSLTGLTITSPIFLVVAVVLYLFNRGDIFYVQPRMGRAGHVFGMIKFATMKPDSPNELSGLITKADDPRVTRIGKALRAWKINELPQLINVLRGEISLVGPRPLPVNYFKPSLTSEFPFAMTVRPGLTSCSSLLFHAEERFFTDWDVNEETDQNEILPVKLQIDDEFFKCISVNSYLRVVLYTALLVLGVRAHKSYALRFLDETRVVNPALRQWLCH